jgi:hypothetical protein
MGQLDATCTAPPETTSAEINAPTRGSLLRPTARGAPTWWWGLPPRRVALTPGCQIGYVVGESVCASHSAAECAYIHVRRTVQ